MLITITDGSAIMWRQDIDSLQLRQLNEFANDLVAPDENTAHTLLTLSVDDFIDLDEQEDEDEYKYWAKNWASLTQDERVYVANQVSDYIYDGDTFRDAITNELSRLIKEKENAKTDTGSQPTPTN